MVRGVATHLMFAGEASPALALYAAVFTVRLLSDTTVDAYSIFYVLPVALAATAFGQRGGLVSSLLAIALMVVYRLISGVSHTPVGWATRVVPLLLLGIHRY